MRTSATSLAMFVFINDNNIMRTNLLHSKTAPMGTNISWACINKIQRSNKKLNCENHLQKNGITNKAANYRESVKGLTLTGLGRKR